MKKKLLLIALMVVMVVCALAISISAVEVDGIHYSLTKSENGNTAAVTNANKNCALEVVNIPETITVDGDTYTVTSLWSEAFSGSGWPGNKTVKKITIPKTVSSIGTHCFRNCTALEEVYINGTTKSFSNAEFYSCTSLWKLDMSGMTEEVTIGQYFAFNTALSDLKLPPKLTKISGTTPFKSSALTSLELPDTVTHLGDYAFQNCSNLRTVKLSKNLTYLGKNNFQNSKIKEIVIPATLTQIQNHVFHGSSLERVVFASTQVTSYNSQAFDGAGSLKILFYPSVTEEEAKTFTAQDVKLKGFTNYISYEDYDPNASYTSTIVYGTSNCENCHDLVGDSALYATDTVSKIVEKIVCEACGNETVISEMNAPIKYLGFSKNMAGTSLCIGYEIDFDALVKYEDITGKAITWGVVGYAPKEYDDKNALKPVKDDLSLQDAGTTIFAPLERTYKSFEFKISGFSASTKDSELVMCAYVSDGSTVSYLNINQENNTVVQSEYATLITYNKYE